MSSVPAVPAHQWIWSRPIAPRWADAWLERIAFVGADRVTLVEKPGIKMARLEAYPEDKKTADRLVQHFGGRLRKLAAKTWIGKSAPALPIKFGRRLVVCGGKKPPAAEFPGAAILRLPAGLAFGTGQHATTGMILRELSNHSSWQGARVLDAGTGSGILALALRALGAEQVEAFDYDPTALRVARENELLNFKKGSVSWSEQDVLKWKSPAVYDAVCANLFSELLVSRATVLAKALKRGGLLFFSGVLADQLPGVRKALAAAGLEEEAAKRKGKWTMGRWRKPAKRSR